MNTHSTSAFARVPWLVAALIGIAEMATDMYVPSMPQISEFFGVNESTTQLTVSFNLIGLGLSALIYGPLSDSYGRRRVILVGLSVFFLGSLACSFSSNILTLMAARFFQGMGSGVCLAVGHAAIQDLFSGERCAQMHSRLSMVIALSPGIAPIIGGYIAVALNWPAIFVAITIAVAFLWAVIFLQFPETLPESKRQSFSLKYLLRAYGRLFSNLRFVGYAFIHVMTITWVWADAANLPFVFIEGMDLPLDRYGYFFASLIVAYILGTYLNQKLVVKLGMTTMLFLGLSLTAISGIAIIIAHYLIDLNPLIATAIKLPGSTGLAFIFGSAPPRAIGIAGEDSGSGAAVLSSWQMLFGSIGIYLVGLAYNGTMLPIAYMTVSCATVSFIVYFILHRGKLRPIPVGQ